MIDFIHRFLRQSITELNEGEMIRRLLIERKPEEFLEGNTVIDLSFEFGFGINMKPLLKQQGFEQKQGRISASAFNAFTDSIMFQQQVFDGRPVNNGIAEINEAPVPFRWKKFDLELT
jgi:hypothetical protein